ncbi:urea transporter 2-like isoform X2 [Apis cerana]|uniref:urea transporter 2-like isoform X2 n=1 Tax=Apis cerana TaxID=7461 RepID=UPI002B233446|nr:urea transporter 2-like isoform X2 [Apis cerana]
MTVNEQLKESPRHDYSWPVFIGNFSILQEYLSEKKSYLWSVVRLFDFLLRGFGQVVFSNNPISGLLIIISLGATSPGTLLFAASTGFLGLLLSMLLRDPQEHIANGLTVFNPLLVGAVSYALIPKVYGPFDSLSILLILLGTIFSVYMTRSMRDNKIPAMAWPFNLAEFALLLVLYTKHNGLDTAEKLQLMRMDNATSDATTSNVSFIGENATGVHIDWGMIFHGVIVSASQVVAVENAITGCVVYLAILLFSPKAASFAFLGAFIGSLTALIFGAPINEIYIGFWGFNTLLTGISLGGFFYTFNGQMVAATIVAIIYTMIVQYSILFLFKNLKLPILSLPFILVTSLFLKLRNNSGNKISSQSPSIPSSQKQSQDYLANPQFHLIPQAEHVPVEIVKGDIDKDKRLKYVRNLRKSQVAKIYLISNDSQYDKTLIVINTITNFTYLMHVIFHIIINKLFLC